MTYSCLHQGLEGVPVEVGLDWNPTSKSIGEHEYYLGGGGAKGGGKEEEEEEEGEEEEEEEEEEGVGCSELNYHMWSYRSPTSLLHTRRSAGNRHRKYTHTV